MPFDRETGKPTISFGDGEDYTSITAEYIMQKAKSDSEVSCDYSCYAGQVAEA